MYWKREQVIYCEITDKISNNHHQSKTKMTGPRIQEILFYLNVKIS